MFAFGYARYLGSIGAIRPAKPSVSAAPEQSRPDGDQRGVIPYEEGTTRLAGTLWFDVAETNEVAGPGHALGLLGPLNPAQQRVVDCLAEVFFNTGGTWPTFLYLQARLDQERIDATTALASFPAVGGRTFVEARYAAVWAENFGSTPHPAGRVGLTLAGLAHCRDSSQEAAQTAIRLSLVVISWMAEIRRQFLPSPTDVEYPTVTSEEVQEELRRRRNNWPAAILYRLMEHEPPLLGGSRSGPADDGSWTWEPPRGLLGFEDVGDVADYVQRVTSLVRPPAVFVPPSAPSPRGLVAALDYLDTVWRLVSGRPDHLVELPGAERTAQLAYPANTADEFSSRLSALGEILKHLHVPPGGEQKGGHPVERLREYLVAKLDAESHDRVIAGTDVLRRVVEVRNGWHHAAADTKGVQALKELGVGYPIVDWVGAWEAIQARTIEALDGLREELGQ